MSKDFASTVSINDFTPQSWLCAALSQRGLDQAFKIISIDGGPPARGPGVVRVLHKDTGAVWTFTCAVEREPVK